MKMNWRIWIPLFGIYFVKDEPLILLHDDYWNYQFMCFLVSAIMWLS